MKFLKDYGCTIQYHPGGANVVANALSKSVPTIITRLMACEWNSLEAFSQLAVSPVPRRLFVLIVGVTVQMDL